MPSRNRVTEGGGSDRTAHGYLYERLLGSRDQPGDLILMGPNPVRSTRLIAGGGPEVIRCVTVTTSEAASPSVIGAMRMLNSAALRALASDDVDAALGAARALSRLLDDPTLACLDASPDGC